MTQNPLPFSNQELFQIQKPMQYVGGETGSVTKSDAGVELHVCLAFPDAYEVGMSHVGMQILYDLLNRDSRIWAERAYVPLPDMEQLMRKNHSQWYSLESRRVLSRFDVIGFSLQYELCATGILTILDLGGVPLLGRDRTEQDPIIIGGGPMSYHPEPVADFFDAFLVGDGEELVPEFMELMLEAKRNNWSRKQKLQRMSQIQGVYVPSLFEPQYNSEQQFVGMRALLPGYEQVRRRIISSLENAPYPRSPVVPNIKAVHDRLSVEVMRGCVRGCRFCQAGYLYRPQRERKPEDLLQIIGDSLGKTGFEEVSLLSLSTADYCSILPLLSSLKEKYAENDNLAISFPSTRVDALKPELLQEVQPVRRSGFTLAPEAGTQRLRDVINKGVSDAEIIQTCSNVFRLGWSSVKLYFMIGLPTETDEDIYGIIDLGKRVKQIAGRKNDVVVSVSTLVPKPHTPFQWAAQIDAAETQRKQKILRDELKRLRVTFRYHEAPASVLEGVFARGDRRLGTVILEAYRSGLRFEGWVEKLDFNAWDSILKKSGISIEQALGEKSLDAALPWDHISCDIPKHYFRKEWERACAQRITPDCLTQSCSSCGACDYDATRNVLWDRTRSENRMQAEFPRLKNPPWNTIINAREQLKSMPESASSEGKNESAAEVLVVPAVLEAEKNSQNDAPIHEQTGSYKLKEYLKTEVDKNPSDAAGRPALPLEQRIRLRYHKRGAIRFSAHLELASVFFRAARRAKLPIAFSRGFNPKPKFSFGPPLQLGLESLCEYLDIYLHKRIQPIELLRGLNSELPVGLKVVWAEEIEIQAPSLQSVLRTQSFEAISTASNGQAELVEVPENWETMPVIRSRKNRSSSIPLSSCVEKLRSEEGRLCFNLSCDSMAQSLKPAEVLQCLAKDRSDYFVLQKVAAEFRAN